MEAREEVVCVRFDIMGLMVININDVHDETFVRTFMWLLKKSYMLIVRIVNQEVSTINIIQRNLSAHHVSMLRSVWLIRPGLCEEVRILAHSLH